MIFKIGTIFSHKLVSGNDMDCCYQVLKEFEIPGIIHDVKQYIMEQYASRLPENISDADLNPYVNGMIMEFLEKNKYIFPYVLFHDMLVFDTMDGNFSVYRGKFNSKNKLIDLKNC